MQKAQTIEEVVYLLKKLYIENIQSLQPDPTNKTSYHNTIVKLYDKLNKSMNVSIEKKTNKYFYDYFDSDTKKIKKTTTINHDYIGSLCRLRREQVYTKDIIKYEINSLYPMVISLIYHNTDRIDDLSYYVYLVDNKNEIEKQLSDNEKFMFELLINYKYGILFRIYETLITYLMEGINKIIEEIYDDDKYLDIIYLDTYNFFIANTIEGNKLLTEKISKFFKFKKTHYNYGFFVKKKKYFLFDDEPISKGFDAHNNFYANKQRRNLAYNISGSIW